MFARFLCLILILSTPAIVHAQREKLPPKDLAWVEKTYPDAIKTNTGMRYVVIKEGSGEKARRGDMVSVLYSGRLVDGPTFDEVTDPNHPFSFRLGRNYVIPGWDYILQLMRPGDKWIVIVPPELAYGTRGRLPEIPRNATLVFSMELVKVQRPED